MYTECIFAAVFFSNDCYLNDFFYTVQAERNLFYFHMDKKEKKEKAGISYETEF